MTQIQHDSNLLYTDQAIMS